MAQEKTQSGTQADRYGRPVGRSGGRTMTSEYVEYWDQRIRDDLNERLGKWDPVWEMMEQLVRNSETGYRDGNVVAEFIKTLHARLLTDDLSCDVDSDDPSYTDQAESAAVVAESLQRICDLTNVSQDVTTQATWASFGVFELGHPIDPASHDPYMSFRCPNYGRDDQAQDQWEEASPEEVATMGGQTDNVVPFSPEQQSLLAGGMGMDDPQPVYSPAFGYPWVKPLDPRLVVMPLNVKDPHNAPYIARIRFITRAELRLVRGYDADASTVGIVGQYQDLFHKTQEDGAIDLFPEMMMIMEVYIKRDRNNPDYNGWFFSYVFGQPDKVIHQGQNPHGGMIPLVFTKLSRLKKMYDTTLAKELSRYADIYHIGIQAMERNLEQMLEDKTLVAPSAGLQEPEEKKLFNKNYRGPVKVNDPNGVVKYGENEFNVDLVRAMSYIKSLAQSSTGQSDLDRGTAIKEITARQTQALLDATGINVEDMANQLSRAVTEVVMKLMHLAGLYSMAGRSRQFSFGGKFTSFSRGTHDFTTSFVYRVIVNDRGTEATQEERMVWVQFLRTLFQDTSGYLAPYYDREGLAKATLKFFRQGTNLLASRAAGREGQGVSPEAVQGLQPGGSADLSNALAGGGNPMLNEMVQGQHPERDVGSRGMDLGNAMRGALATGSGAGEL